MKIENHCLSVEFCAQGAEIITIFDKEKERNILWEGDPKYWGGQSPILFPNVGKSYGDVIRVDGIEYPTTRHGFARRSVFTCVESQGEKIRFQLSSNEDTKRVFPFDFHLYVSYSLEGKEIKVEWEVENPSEQTMYFTIGAHPALRFVETDEEKSAYYLKFPKKDQLEYVLIDMATGCALQNQSHCLTLEKHQLPLSEKLFEKDALVFDQGQIEEVWIHRANGDPYVGMRCEGFSNFGIWSVQDAPFVCLEPWAGRCDNDGFQGELSEKPDVNCLPGKQSWCKGYRLIVA